MLCFRFCLVLAAALIGVPALAQSPAAVPDTGANDSADAAADCTYDLCALRVEPALFSSPRIVAGSDGVPVGRLGLFGNDLSAAVATNEMALAQARIYERERGSALIAVLASTALYSVAATATVRGDDAAALQTAALVGALASSVVGLRFALRSQRAASRAVWEYNRDLPR